METNINTLSTPMPAQVSGVEKYKNEKNKPGTKKKKIYTANAVVAKREGDKAKRLSVAVFIIFSGMIFLARNFGILEFSFFEGLTALLPLAFIVMGICLAAKDGWWAVGLAIITLIAISAMTIMLANGVFDKKNDYQAVKINSGVIMEQDYLMRN